MTSDKDQHVLALYQRMLDTMQYPNDLSRERQAKALLGLLESMYGVEETQRLVEITASVIEQELARIRSERQASTI